MIYLDYHATTPCDPRVTELIDECLRNSCGNPSSAHRLGKEAKKRVEKSRGIIASHIGAFAGEIIFTGNATESNNIAILGSIAAWEESRTEGTKSANVITSGIEHKSILKPLDCIGEDIAVKVAPVNEDGVVDVGAVSRLISKDTVLVTIQAANNEIGTIQPVAELAELAKENDALFHTDAVQALGRRDIDVQEWGVDLLSLSAHKAYGPKGIGALYIRGGPESAPVSPVMYGGGQEGELRPGTLAVSSIVGFGKAVKIIADENTDERQRLSQLRDRCEEIILSDVEGAEVVGGGMPRLPSVTNIHLPGVEAEALIARVPEVAISTGSACESGAPEPSHVLQALGMSREKAYECIRISVGRFTEESDIDRAASRIVAEAQRICALGV